MYGDATDSNNTKRDTVQGVLDLASSGLKFISSTDISGAATHAFTAVVAASYEMYLISFDNIIPATDSVALEMRTSSNAGSSYDSGASDYGFEMDYKGVYTSDKADDSLALIPNAGSLSGFGAGSASNKMGVGGVAWVHAPHATTFTRVSCNINVMADDGNIYDYNSGGVRLSAADVDSWQFFFSSRSIESGTISTFGLSNA